MENKKTNNTVQAAWVGIGSLSSFLFSLISTAILSRYLLKADYGTYKQVMYVYNTLLVVFTLGLPKAYGYFLPRYKLEEGNHVVNKLNACFFVMGGFFSLLLYFGSPLIAVILKNPDLEVALKIFSPAPIFILPRMGLEGIMATYRKTHINTIFLVTTRCLSIICVALPVAFYRADVSVALYGFIVAAFLTGCIAIYVKKIPFKGVKKIKSEITYKQIFSFSMPLMIAAVWGVAIKAADQFFVSRWFGQEIFAEFSNGSLELPFVQMVLGAGGVVLLPLFSKYMSNSECCDKSEILALWTRVTEKACLIIYPLVIYCWFFSPLVMTFLYGDQYYSSSIYFRIMLVANLFTIAQYYPIIVALGATKYYARVHMICAVLVWTLEYVVVLVYPSPYMITIVSVICHIIKIFLMISFISNYFELNVFQLFPMKKLFLIFSCCVFSGLICMFIFSFFSNLEKIIVLSVSFALYMGLTLAIGKLMRIDFFLVVKPIIGRFLKKCS